MTTANAVRVSLAGELDMSSASRFEQELRHHEGERGVLIVDLSALRFIDSTGLKLLLSANARAKRDGRRLRVVPGQEAVRRIFHFTGVEKLLEVAPEPAPAPAP